MHDLGATRSAQRSHYLLQTPDTFVRTTWPGLRNGDAVVHTGPAAGARFSQSTVKFQHGGELAGSGLERFAYVLEGAVTLEGEGFAAQHCGPGGFCFLPAETPHVLTAAGPARLAVIERRYAALPGANLPRPAVLCGQEQHTQGEPLMGDERVIVRSLLPSTAEFDFAVNTMTYQPGAALSMVEIHVMEHGLLMLEGGGIYRLGDDWHPVQAGDFIWMAPFCPQWFGALGRAPARYLIYKDINRPPLQAGAGRNTP